jgi:hypothetical protein
MKVRVCEACGQHNPEDAWYCSNPNCGESLPQSAITELDDSLVKLSPPPPEPPDVRASRVAAELSRTHHDTSPASGLSASETPRYGALRGIASLCTGLGVLALVLAGLGLLAGFVMMTVGGGFLPGFGVIIVSVATGGFYYIVLRVVAEGISVFVDIEENTRHTALYVQRAVALLEKRLK